MWVDVGGGVRVCVCVVPGGFGRRNPAGPPLKDDTRFHPAIILEGRVLDESLAVQGDHCATANSELAELPRCVVDR